MLLALPNRTLAAVNRTARRPVHVWCRLQAGKATVELRVYPKVMSNFAVKSVSSDQHHCTNTHHPRTVPSRSRTVSSWYCSLQVCEARALGASLPTECQLTLTSAGCTHSRFRSMYCLSLYCIGWLEDLRTIPTENSVPILNSIRLAP